MLLYLLHDRFRELPRQPLPAVPLARRQRALFFSGLFLSVWCLLRLVATGGEHFEVDIALAVSALYLGLRAIRHSAARSIGRPNAA